MVEFARVRVYLLGTFRVERDGETVHLGRHKVEALLAYLALFPDIHTRDQLAALLWGDSPDQQARTSLRTALVTLRRALGDEIVIADRDTVQLNPDLQIWADIHELERANLQSSISSLQSLGSLYRGDLLTEFYDDWVLTERERYRAIYLDGLLALTQAYRSSSDYARAIETAQTILQNDPANEHAFQHIMFCQLAQGNRNAALDTYARCVTALQDELGVEPEPETRALYEWLKQTPTGTTLAAKITNLPIPLTSFVGRAREMSTVKQLLVRDAQLSRGNGLVTLTGAGGTGKTRLAMQVATDLIDVFHEGVWWVELAPLTDPHLVPQAVAKSLGVRERTNEALSDTLVNALGANSLLLVLDNCEHLIEPCVVLAEKLLTHCPNLKVLATSREPLDIPGEQVWNVPTLAVPQVQASSLAELALSFEGIRLFCERARALKSDFALTDENVVAVAQICQRLDGIPLAIELAAARVNVLTPAQIAERLDDRFNLLTQNHRTVLPRQQTLRALIDWSYDLLTEDERILFRRLAVMRGGSTLEAIEAICSAPPLTRGRVFDLVARLVAKSLLVVQESANTSRYLFLDTIQHYALEKLSGSGEAASLYTAQLDYFCQFAETAAPLFEGPAQVEWFARVESEHANLRAALGFALEQHQSALALRLSGALEEFWQVRGYLAEGRQWLEQALQAGRAAFDSAPTNDFRLVYARTALQTAALALTQGDYARTRELAQAHLELFRELDARASFGMAEIILGKVARLQSSWETAREHFERGLAEMRTLNNPNGIAHAVRELGGIAESLGDYPRARALYQEALDASRSAGNTRDIATALNRLGGLEQQMGEYAQARADYVQARNLYAALGHRWSIAAVLTNLGNVAHSEGDYPSARAYHEEALGMMRELGDRRGTAVISSNLGNAYLLLADYPHARALHQQSLELRRALGDKRGVGMVLGNLADVEASSGNPNGALDLYVQSLRALREVGDRRTSLNCLIGIAGLIVDTDTPRAVRLAGAITRHLTDLNARLDKREQSHLDEMVRRARARLAPEEFERAWSEGAEFSFEQAIQVALSDP